MLSSPNAIMKHMSYTINPNLPRMRMRAAQLAIRDGWSTRAVSKYTGYNQSTIVRWINKARRSNLLIIPTESSRPYLHPDALPEDIVCRILELRRERNQCAEIIHHRLIQERRNYTINFLFVVTE